MTRLIVKTLVVVLLGFLVCLGGVAQEQDQEEEQQQGTKEKEEEEATQPFGFGLPQEQPQEQQPQQPSVTPEEREAVEKMIEEESPERRIEMAKQFLADYPESLFRGRAYAALAEAYRMQNSLDEAIESGEKALELSPNDAVTMIVVADSLVESALPTREDYKERLARAEDYVRQALELMPELFASVERRPGVPEEEYQRREQYIEAQARAVLGYVYLRQHKYELAEGELTQAVNLVPEKPNPMDFLRLGFAHVRQREYEQARDAFQRCVNEVEDNTRNCRQQLDRMQRIVDRRAAQENSTEE